MKKLEFKKEDAILQNLSSSDERLAVLINKVGDYTLNLRTDYLPSLVRAIIGQQLSVGAARTIYTGKSGLVQQIVPCYN